MLLPSGLRVTEFGEEEGKRLYSTSNSPYMGFQLRTMRVYVVEAHMWLGIVKMAQWSCLVLNSL